MKKLVEATCDEARTYFLKESSYFNRGLPPYISFEPILVEVGDVLKGGSFKGFKAKTQKTIRTLITTFWQTKMGVFHGANMS